LCWNMVGGCNTIALGGQNHSLTRCKIDAKGGNSGRAISTFFIIKQEDIKWQRLRV
jgi:hypothetical protein